MWLIFKASQIKNVQSDSVIKDHRQVIVENDLEYLYHEVLDYQDLLRELPPEHKWGGEEVQTALKNMTGVKIDELNKVQEIFDLHIDVFALRDLTSVEKRVKETIRKQQAQW